MSLKKRYALFDWDNTVRREYTLFTWVDYLCENFLVDKNLQISLGQIKEDYAEKKISHDQYANKACLQYAMSLKGISWKTFDCAAKKYIVYDESYLFKNIDILFHALNKSKIDIIVISGAPTIVLDNYKNKYNITEIYAFKEQVIRGRFTGLVEYNYGYNKEVITRKIIEQYYAYPYLAFGDSSSDYPMLDCAMHPFYISKNRKEIKYNSIDIEKEIDQVMCFL